MNVYVGMRFIGNVNRAEMEVVKIENGNVSVKDCKTGRIFQHGLEALKRCNITILE